MLNMLNNKKQCGKHLEMNNKVTILRTINLIQRLSQAYYMLSINYLQGVYDTENVKVSDFVENIMAEVQQQILELNQLLSEYSENPCTFCKGRGIIPDETYPKDNWGYMECPECSK